ncbi:MAG: hypothetical protein AAFY98_08075 [Verrucomicrobiota bacterium]
MKHLSSLFSLSLCALFIATPLSAQDNAKLLSAGGKVMMKIDADAEPIEIKPGASVPTGATLITPGSGLVLLGIAPGAAAIIEPSTTLTIDRNKTDRSSQTMKRDVSLNMTSKTGGVISMLKKQEGPISYSIRNPIGVAAARGTIYRVTGSMVQVIEGNVVVTIDGRQIFLGPLEQVDGEGFKVDLDGDIEDELLAMIQQAGGSVTKLSDDDIFEDDLGGPDNGNPGNNLNDIVPEPEMEMEMQEPPILEECEDF